MHNKQNLGSQKLKVENCPGHLNVLKIFTSIFYKFSMKSLWLKLIGNWKTFWRHHLLILTALLFFFMIDIDKLFQPSFSWKKVHYAQLFKNDSLFNRVRPIQPVLSDGYCKLPDSGGWCPAVLQPSCWKVPKYLSFKHYWHFAQTVCLALELGNNSHMSSR